MSITSANAVFLLGVTGLFSVPQQLQRFAADDVFSTESIKRIETIMGVDGYLSAGFVNVEVKMNVMLQADSPSGFLFDQWDAAQQAAGEAYEANGTIILPSIGKKWTMTRGFLTGYKPIPDAKKVMQPRTFELTWNLLSSSPS